MIVYRPVVLVVQYMSISYLMYSKIILPFVIQMAGSSSIPLALPESLEDRVGEDDEDDEPSDTAAASAASEISLGYSIQHEDSLDNLDSGTGDDFWENGTNDDATSPSLDIPVSPGQDEGINSPSAESVNTYSSGIDNNAPNIYDIRTSSSVSLDANLNESTETSRTDNTNFVSDSGLLSQALKLFSLIQEHNITGARELLEQMEPNQRQEVCDMHVSDKTVATSVAEAGMVDVLEMLTDYDVTLSGYDNYGKAPIHYAAEHGHILAVYFITSTNKKNREMVDILVNMTTKYGNLTALHIAAAGENVEVIDLLVLRGSDMNARDITGNTPLHLAAKQGSVVIPERLLEHGAEVNLQNKMGETALFCACQHGHAETVSVLSTHGANVNIPQELGWTPLHIACHNAHTVIIYQLLDLNADPYCLSRDKSMPVILACRHRLKSAIRRMIFRKGESKRMQEPDPLVIFKMAQVASVSDFSVVKECGVNVNTQNYFKQTALHHAARNGDIGAMMTLLSATASTDIWDNNGNFPLHLALLHRHTEVAKQLILHGTPLNRQNRWHQSCLYLAIQNGNYDLIELLLRNSADPNSVDPQGGSLIALAIRNDTVRLLEMLLRYNVISNFGHCWIV